MRPIMARTALSSSGSLMSSRRISGWEAGSATTVLVPRRGVGGWFHRGGLKTTGLYCLNPALHRLVALPARSGEIVTQGLPADVLQRGNRHHANRRVFRVKLLDQVWYSRDIALIGGILNRKELGGWIGRIEAAVDGGRAAASSRQPRAARGDTHVTHRQQDRAFGGRTPRRPRHRACSVVNPPAGS